MAHHRLIGARSLVTCPASCTASRGAGSSMVRSHIRIDSTLLVGFGFDSGQHCLRRNGPVPCRAVRPLASIAGGVAQLGLLIFFSYIRCLRCACSRPVLGHTSHSLQGTLVEFENSQHVRCAIVDLHSRRSKCSYQPNRSMNPKGSILCGL